MQESGEYTYTYKDKVYQKIKVDPQPIERVVAAGVWESDDAEAFTWQYQRSVKEPGSELTYCETLPLENVPENVKVLTKIDGVWYWLVLEVSEVLDAQK